MLKQRTEILAQGKVISKEVRDFVIDVIDCMHEQYPEVEDEKAVMFITHLAMAAERVSKGDIAGHIDARLFAEAYASEGYDKALEFMGKIKELTFVPFPDSEEEFLILHLCNLFCP